MGPSSLDRVGRGSSSDHRVESRDPRTPVRVWRQASRGWPGAWVSAIRAPGQIPGSAIQSWGLWAGPQSLLSPELEMCETVSDTHCDTARPRAVGLCSQPTWGQHLVPPLTTVWPCTRPFPSVRQQIIWKVGVPSPILSHFRAAAHLMMEAAGGP